jgi:hypothetical protein
VGQFRHVGELRYLGQLRHVGKSDPDHRGELGAVNEATVLNQTRSALLTAGECSSEGVVKRGAFPKLNLLHSGAGTEGPER